MPPPAIAGLYPYTRGGVTQLPKFTLAEIPASLAINPGYRDDLLVLAGDDGSARQLEGFGLRVHRVFDDAPLEIHRDSAHKMKHWMCRWALKEFGEFLWLDWDTVQLKRPDEAFWKWCRAHGTPKFIHIQNYWAVVNCGVYYANAQWAGAMDRSFCERVSKPNDELLWASVLPGDIQDRSEFWWGSRVAHIWTRDDFAKLGPDTCFAHVKKLDWAGDIRAYVK
ncbi:MAG: hypothetical protein HY897_24995 [Deltaproteobacteria bacterium]|nr:hypothetical protein [Deltaproteobacteria bacterium]